MSRRFMMLDEVSCEDVIDDILPDDLPDEIKDRSYTHYQSTPSSVWQVVHNLGKYPSVIVTDIYGKEKIPEISNIDINTLECRFRYANIGYVHCN